LTEDALHLQAKARKKHNGLFVLACARGYLGDVRTHPIASAAACFAAGSMPLAFARPQLPASLPGYTCTHPAHEDAPLKRQARCLPLAPAPPVQLILPVLSRHRPRKRGIAARCAQVEKLVEMGADAAARDKRGVSALHYACGQGQAEVVRFLWSRGTDLDAEDPGAPRRARAATSWNIMFASGNDMEWEGHPLLCSEPLCCAVSRCVELCLGTTLICCTQTQACPATLHCRPRLCARAARTQTPSVPGTSACSPLASHGLYTPCALYPMRLPSILLHPGLGRGSACWGMVQPALPSPLQQRPSGRRRAHAGALGRAGRPDRGAAPAAGEARVGGGRRRRRRHAAPPGGAVRAAALCLLQLAAATCGCGGAHSWGTGACAVGAGGCACQQTRTGPPTREWQRAP